MATKRSSKRTTIPKDEDGKPDIYVLTQEREMSFKEASEAAGINYATAHSLFWKQELQHEPDLKVSGTAKQIAKAVVALRDGEEKMRWERIALRVGKTKNEVIAIYAEATGQDPDDVKRRPAKPKPKKSAAKKSKKAPVVDEDEDEEEEDIEDEDEDEDEDDDDVEDDEDEDEEEDEEPAPPKRRGRKK